MHTDKTHEHSQLVHTSLLLTVGLSNKVFQSWSASSAKMWGRESALLGEVLKTPPPPPPLSPNQALYGTLLEQLCDACAESCRLFTDVLQNEENKYKKKTLL